MMIDEADVRTRIDEGAVHAGKLRNLALTVNAEEGMSKRPDIGVDLCASPSKYMVNLQLPSGLSAN
jgi:hypothetical protein